MKMKLLQIVQNHSMILRIVVILDYSFLYKIPFLLDFVNIYDCVSTKNHLLSKPKLKIYNLISIYFFYHKKSFILF